MHTIYVSFIYIINSGTYMHYTKSDTKLDVGFLVIAFLSFFTVILICAILCASVCKIVEVSVLQLSSVASCNKISESFLLEFPTLYKHSRNLKPCDHQLNPIDI